MEENPQNPGEPKIVYRHRPGDRIYRVPKMITQRITIPKISPPKRKVGVSLLSFVYGFAVMIAIGTVLLMLPFSSNSYQFTSIIDCLFTATSAVCVTGLVVVDTLNHWNFIGQLIIIVLIQFGGLGFMISSTAFLMATGRRIGLRDRILIHAAVGEQKTRGAVRLARNIISFFLTFEILGAAIFFLRFSSQYEWKESIWMSIFQAVSAFNNAGFDLFGNFRSIADYSNDYLFVLTTAGLVILGGIGFVVFNNIREARGLHHSTVDTKLVLMISAILLASGTLLVLAIEYNNPLTLGNMTLPDKILNAFFLSVTSRSAGFTTINTGVLGIYTLFLIMILMFIGGATGSSAGGIKVNTVGLIAATIWGTIKGREHPGAFGREFPHDQIFRGLTLLVLFLLIISGAFFILSITENFSSIQLLFEIVSATGGVGLSTGITPDLSILGKIVIIILMFMGRLGPLTLVLALARNRQVSKYRYPVGSIRIG